MRIIMRSLLRLPSIRRLSSARSISPVSGKVIQEYTFISDAAAAAAIDSSHAAFKGWSEAGFDARGSKLHAAAALLRERSDELCRLMADEMGKPIAEGAGEVAKCADHLDYYAANAEEMMESEHTEVPGAIVTFRPLGVIFAIMPWNFPLWQVFRQAGTALSAGNTIALKHAPNVFGCAEAIEKIFMDAGFPPGVFVNLAIDTPQAPYPLCQPLPPTRNLSDVHIPAGRLAPVPRPPAALSIQYANPFARGQVPAIIGHSAVRMVALTGSCGAGRAVAAEAGRNLKKVVSS